VLPRYRLAVFVDGCFWHGCQRHGRSTFTGPNADLWNQKLDRNKQRDARANSLATEAGWRVMRLWECDILADPTAAAIAVEAECFENPSYVGPGLARCSNDTPTAGDETDASMS